MSNTTQQEPTIPFNIGTDLRFTPEARQTITAMKDRVNELRAWYGPDHAATMKAERSLAAVLVTMIGLGGFIGKDGDISLFCRNEHIAYGVIWHNDPYPDVAYAEGVDGSKFLISGVPRPGEWSVHS